MPHLADFDARLAALAVAQHGAFTRAQATESGLSADQVDRRARAGDWVRVLPRVYRHAATPASVLLLHSAAVLWAGAGAALSHASAAALWRLDGVRVAAPELVVPMQRGPSAPGVVVHRARCVAADEVAAIAGMPVTSPVRTLVDLASVVDDPTLQRAAESAIARRLVTGPAVVAWLERRGSAGRPGVRRLRRVLAAAGALGSGRVRASARLVG